MSVSISSNTLRRPLVASRQARPQNMSELLLRAARQHPFSGIAFVSGGRDERAAMLTHPALLEEAQRVLGGLRAYGLAPGARVALLLERARDFIPAFWGCVLGGYVPCPLAPIRNDPQRWTTHLANASAVLDEPLIVTVGALEEEALACPLVVADLDALRKHAPDTHTFVADPSAIAFLMLTSGSTGNSKAVALTHANVLASMVGKSERQEISAGDTTLNWISFEHVAALLEVHMVSLYVGATQLHAEASAILADPLLFLHLIDRNRVTLTFSPNFLLGQINATLEAMPASAADSPPLSLDLSCVRYIVSGGEANVVDTGRRFLDFLAPYGLTPTALRPAFGMTETCAGSVYSADFYDADAQSEFAAVGRPIAGLQMRIVNEEGAIAPPGEAGELQLRGSMIFPQYYNNPEATLAAFTSDGWFRTGDLGRVQEGRLSLVGRSKDSIIVSGVNYFSHELETTLEQLDGVERSFVAVFPTRPKGADTEQLVVCFATSLAAEDDEGLHQLLVAIRNTTILLWGFRPTLILPLRKDAFPKTSLGKIQRSLLRKRLEAGDLAGAEAAVAELTRLQVGPHTAAAGATEVAVAAMYAAVFGLDAEKVSATASFFDLGGTSLDIFKLKSRLEKHFGLADVPVVTILQNPTVRSLAARVVAGKRAGRADYEPMVPLQLSGRKSPVFCIHPGTGEVLVFVSLANYFVNDRPFYALRARGFNKGEAYFDNFDEMVRAYVEAIRKCQPHGPYALAGYSFGGPVAFEIAKVLEAQGERVGFIGQIDAAPFIGWHSGRKLDYVDSTVIVGFFLSLIDRVDLDTLPDRIRAEQVGEDVCEYLVRHAPPERLQQLNLNLQKFKDWAALAYSLVTIGQAYTPSGKVDSVSVFYAQPLSGTKEECLEQQLRKWDDYTRNPNRYVEVAGEHHTLLGPRHVASFQAAMRAEIDRTMDGK